MPIRTIAGASSSIACLPQVLYSEYPTQTGWGPQGTDPNYGLQAAEATGIRSTALPIQVPAPKSFSPGRGRRESLHLSLGRRKPVPISPDRGCPCRPQPPTQALMVPSWTLASVLSPAFGALSRGLQMHTKRNTWGLWQRKSASR